MTFGLITILLSIQRFSNFRKVNIQIIIDVNFDCGVKGILYAEQIFPKVIYHNGFAAEIHNPLFTDTSIFVAIQFADIIICSVSWRGDFNDKVWGAITSVFIQFIFITDIIISGWRYYSKHHAKKHLAIPSGL